MILNAVKRNNFNGQNIYEGLDTHHKRRMESIYSDEFELKIFNQQPGVDQLERYLKRNYPGAIIIWHMKQGFNGCPIQRSFTQKWIHCDVIHPADTPGSDKENKRKTINRIVVI